MSSSRKPYEIKVTASPYPDGSGYAAEATIEPGDDGIPAVNIDNAWRLSHAGWLELKAAIDRGFAMAIETTAHKNGDRT